LDYPSFLEGKKQYIKSTPLSERKPPKEILFCIDEWGNY
jgi:hypothetical protein